MSTPTQQQKPSENNNTTNTTTTTTTPTTPKAAEINVPDSIIRHICSFVYSHELIRLMEVSRRWYRLVSDHFQNEREAVTLCRFWYRINKSLDSLARMIELLQRLQHLSLSYCSDTNDESLIKILSSYAASHDPNILASLNLYYCFKLTDACMESVVKYCPNITAINIGRCHGVNAMGIKQLTALQYLRMIDLSYMDHINEETFLNLLEAIAAMPTMKNIHLNGCDQLTEDQLDELRLKHPNIHFTRPKHTEDNDDQQT